MATQKDIQEALSVIWSQKEKKNDTIENIKKIFSEELPDDKETNWQQPNCGISIPAKLNIYEELLKNNFITEKNGKVEFTPIGEKEAKHITRLQRLAERLLHDVLEIHGKEMDKSACEFEHILSAEVEESICTLLGHPRLCPHGLKIPQGRCCKEETADAKPIITTVDKLNLGEEAQISYLYTQDHTVAHKLMALGLSPGIKIKLHQKSPTLIVITGNTTLALEESVGKNIFVRRK